MTSTDMTYIQQVISWFGQQSSELNYEISVRNKDKKPLGTVKVCEIKGNRKVYAFFPDTTAYPTYVPGKGDGE